MTELNLVIIIGKFLLNKELSISQKRQLIVLSNLNLISFNEKDEIKIREDVRNDMFPHQGDKSFLSYIEECKDCLSDEEIKEEIEVLKVGLNNIYPTNTFNYLFD
jgi:hypothetical protein